VYAKIFLLNQLANKMLQHATPDCISAGSAYLAEKEKKFWSYQLFNNIAALETRS